MPALGDQRRSVDEDLSSKTGSSPFSTPSIRQIDKQGVRPNFGALNAELDRRLAANPLGGFGDRVDFNAAPSETLADSG